MIYNHVEVSGKGMASFNKSLDNLLHGSGGTV